MNVDMQTPGATSAPFQLLPHQQRVVDEKHALDIKIAALLAFGTTPLWPKLELGEREDLSRQLDIMREYSAILQKRIERFQAAQRTPAFSGYPKSADNVGNGPLNLDSDAPLQQPSCPLSKGDADGCEACQ